MATKKAGGSTRNGRDSRSKRLGVKCFGGYVKAGNILIRQRGSSYHPGLNTALGKDYTLFATANGQMRFIRKGPKARRTVEVIVFPKAAG